jgi:hypothetical protein
VTHPAKQRSIFKGQTTSWMYFPSTSDLVHLLPERRRGPWLGCREAGAAARPAGEVRRQRGRAVPGADAGAHAEAGSRQPCGAQGWAISRDDLATEKRGWADVNLEAGSGEGSAGVIGRCPRAQRGLLRASRSCVAAPPAHSPARTPVATIDAASLGTPFHPSRVGRRTVINSAHAAME